MQNAIILSYFSPCEYNTPKKHFLDCLRCLDGIRADVVVVQHILPWQKPIKVPSKFISRWNMSDSVMFYKENLWNIGATLTNASRLIFLDSDVFFTDKNWLNKCERALQQSDIIQPFEDCVWLDSEGREIGKKMSAAVALSQGVSPDASFFHAGFGWGFNRSAFDKIGGFFDLNIAGSGDTALVLALSKATGDSKLMKWFMSKQDSSPSWKRYRETVQAACLKVGFPDGLRLEHRWHGNHEGRNYVNRDKLFRRKDDGEHPIHRRPDGLLVWDDPATDNVGAREYFEGRREDE